MSSNCFDVLISKLIFLNKKFYFNIFLSKKHFKLLSLSQSQTDLNLCQISNTLFTIQIYIKKYFLYLPSNLDQNNKVRRKTITVLQRSQNVLHTYM